MEIDAIYQEHGKIYVIVSMEPKEAKKSKINLTSDTIFINQDYLVPLTIKSDKRSLYIKIPPKMLKAFPKIINGAKWTTDGRYIIIKP